MKKHEHTVRLTDEEEFVAFSYARHFHLNATNPIPTFLAFGAFGYAKKYVIKSEDEKRRIVKEWQAAYPDSNTKELLSLLEKNDKAR